MFWFGPLLHIDRVTQVILYKQDCDDYATMGGYFQRGIVKLCWETIKGHPKRDLTGSWPLLLWFLQAAEINPSAATQTTL